MCDKLKILIINEFYSPVQIGGAEVSVQLLAESFLKMGHDVSVVCTSKKKSIDNVNGVTVYRVKGNLFGWNGESQMQNKMQKILWHVADSYNFCSKWAVAEIIKKVKPDVIHTNNVAHLSCSVWKAAQECDIPVVHTLRDYNLLCFKRTLFNNHKVCKKRCSACIIFSLANKVMSNTVAVVVGISKHILQRHLAEGFFCNARSRVVFNSVNQIDANVKHERTFNIGYLGKIHESKGVEVLIKAFAACGDTKYTLLVAGNGDEAYCRELKNSVSPKTKMCFVGKVNRNDFFDKIDLLVVPSIWEEPFGRTVIEAVAANVPVIAAASGGIPEILEGYKVGTLYKPDDVSDLSAKLDLFMTGRVEFDFSEKKNFIERFSAETISQQYIEIFKSVRK